MKTVITELQKRLRKINLESIFNTVITDQSVREKSVSLHNERLNKGLSPEYNVIRTFKAMRGEVYAERTIRIRTNLGLPTTRVDLKFTGRFRKTLKAIRKAKKLFVTGELYKKDGFITDNVDIKDIFGFSKNDISELNEFAIKKGIVKQALIKQLKK